MDSPLVKFMLLVFVSLINARKLKKITTKDLCGPDKISNSATSAVYFVLSMLHDVPLKTSVAEKDCKT